MQSNISNENNLKQLLTDELFEEYIQSLKSLFQNADSVQRIEQLLVILFQIELEYKVYKKEEYSKQYKDFLDTLKEIITYLLSQGIIPNKEYIHLYNLFANFTFLEDSNITNLLNFFKEDIKNLSADSEDKFTEIYIILLLEILNGNKRTALIEYIKNIVLTNIHIGQQGLHCQFIGMFSSVTDDFSIDVILDVFTYYLDSKIYFTLPLYEKKSLFAWGYELLINSNKFTKDIQTKQLYPQLKNIIDIHIKNNEVEELMYTEFFTMITQFTIYQENEQFEKFNTEITYRCGEVYKNFGQEQKLSQPKEYKNKKKKIAFLFERLVQHSPFKVVFSLLQQLQKNLNFTNQYEIEVYSINYFLPLYNVEEIEKSLTDIGIKVVYPVDTYLELDNYSSRIERAIKIHNTIIENKIDIMIACFNSYDILNFLFVNRTAQTQIYWSHGNHMYDIVNIDKRITSCGIDNNIKFNIQQIGAIIEDDNILDDEEQEILNNLRSELPENKFVLGSIGRLLKMDNDKYINMLEKIMKNNPQTIYIACGIGNIESVKNRFTDDEILSRVYFPGQINVKIYGYIIDLYLDTFPLQGGNSIREFSSKGKVVIRKSMEEMNIFYNLDSWNKYFDYSTPTKKYFYDLFIKELSCGEYETYSQQFIDEYYKKFKDYPIYDNFSDQYYNLTQLCINDKSFFNNITKVIKSFYIAQSHKEKEFIPKTFLNYL